MCSAASNICSTVCVRSVLTFAQFKHESIVFGNALLSAWYNGTYINVSTFLHSIFDPFEVKRLPFYFSIVSLPVQLHIVLFHLYSCTMTWYNVCFSIQFHSTNLGRLNSRMQLCTQYAVQSMPLPFYLQFILNRQQPFTKPVERARPSTMIGETYVMSILT